MIFYWFALYRLVDIHILVTDAQSPTLSLLHEDVLTNVDVKLRSVDFVLNLIAVRNMIDFVDKFQENIQNISTDILASPESSKQKVKIQKNSPILNDKQIMHLLIKNTSETSKTTKIMNLNL